ncbi:MAG: SWIM zinc finger family protein [Gammaproteobacteria bacterium]
MSYFAWKPHIPVAKRRQQAAQKIARFKKQGHRIEPVTIEGRTLTKSFWGKAWCENLERYSDFANRLPRGRTYVRNGSVIDLQMREGVVTALVSGSEIYQVKVQVARVPAAHWNALCRDCAGAIDSLVELLQGRLSKGVMERVCRPGSGLFPSPKDIELSCSCPDWADMCKHVAAVLYGVGARFDTRPELLFRLRNVDESDLLAAAGQEILLAKEAPTSARILDGSDIATLFGLEISGATTQNVPPMRRKPAKTLRKKKTTTSKPRPMKKATARKKASTAGKTKPSPTV